MALAHSNRRVVVCRCAVGTCFNPLHDLAAAVEHVALAFAPPVLHSPSASPGSSISSSSSTPNGPAPLQSRRRHARRRARASSRACLCHTCCNSLASLFDFQSPSQALARASLLQLPPPALSQSAPGSCGCSSLAYCCSGRPLPLEALCARIFPESSACTTGFLHLSK